MANDEDKARAAALNRKAAALEETGNPEKASELRMQAAGLLASEDPEALPAEPHAYPNPVEAKTKVSDSPKAAEPRPLTKRGKPATTKE